MSEYAPYTGFGDDPSTSIKFTILMPNDTLPHWSGGPRLSVREIPGSNRVNVRSTGREPYQVTFDLAVARVEDLNALDAAQGTVAALRYPWGLTKPVGGHYEQILNRAYLTIPGVRLMRIEDERIDPDGYTELRATFLREAP